LDSCWPVREIAAVVEQAGRSESGRARGGQIPMRPTSGSQSIDLLGRWRSRAKKALGSGARPEVAVSAALEESYRDGLLRAAKLLDEQGFPELAQKVRALFDESRGTR
jgi:hypothetical protein